MTMMKAPVEQSSVECSEDLPVFFASFLSPRLVCIAQNVFKYVQRTFYKHFCPTKFIYLYCVMSLSSVGIEKHYQ